MKTFRTVFVSAMVVFMVMISCLCLAGGGYTPTIPAIPVSTTRSNGTAHQNGDVLSWSTAYGRWISSAAGGGSGDLVGPSGATDGNFPLYDGVTGKLLKDSVYGPASFAPAYFTATADGNLATGDAVYISGTNLVKKANPTSSSVHYLTSG